MISPIGHLKVHGLSVPGVTLIACIVLSSHAASEHYDLIMTDRRFTKSFIPGLSGTKSISYVAPNACTVVWVFHALRHICKCRIESWRDSRDLQSLESHLLK